MSGASPWLHVIGIGEDGIEGLSREAVTLVGEAEFIIGGDRHHRLVPGLKAERIAWPSPFDAMIDVIRSYKGRRIVILVTGDPLWYSVGARITKAIPADEIRFHPQLSAFQWAACRLGWSLADCETVTIHGRPAEQVIPCFSPGARLLILTRDGDSPKEVAKLLKNWGFGESRMSVLAALGGKREKRIDGIAGSWRRKAPDFHVLAVECIAGSDARSFGRAPGLTDNHFEHDGQLTKRVVRAATIGALMPYPDAILWDIGAGCGSVAIEWMRAARGATAIAIEPDKARRAMMEVNAARLGAPRLRIVEGEAPGALKGLPVPDAVFIGGGLTDPGVFDAAWNGLRPGGRLVANAVTLESEAMLFGLHERLGGSLERIATSQAIAVGRYRGFRPSMSVTQWSVVKP